ncbi:ZTF-2 protein [Aphelenchoides avenae]|nr:ZTF-2 protein [Aphelenchus avenae]
MRETESSNITENARTAPEAAVRSQELLQMNFAQCLASMTSRDQALGLTMPVVRSPSAATHTHSPFELLHCKPRDERKRRRMNGNLDNTLDGLVAKKADFDPHAKRYQTENEAIELPDEDLEMKRMETDPDVSTRMCSICGYQGKWVSEMIRHKRVHTNDRPFKCKYCNRTSKWKADLIRHVAKTHGIRVVSKYSRSKAFDAHQDVKTPEVERRDVFDNVTRSIQVIQQTHNSPLPSVRPLSIQSHDATAKQLPSSTAYRCLTCFFEQESLEVLINHLRNVHNTAPFECVQCKRAFDSAHLATSHCTLPMGTCSPLAIKINFNTVTVQQSDASFTSAPLSTSPLSSGSMDSEGTPSCLSSRDDDELNGAHACEDCPFRTESLEKLLSHKVGHQEPAGLFHYKCVFCNWFAKKKSAVERHMHLHTSYPAMYMSQVEQNIATPISVSQPLQSSEDAATKPANVANIVAPRPLDAASLARLTAAIPAVAATAPIATNPTMPFPASASLGLLSALYSPLSAMTALQQLPDLSALQQLPMNPLVAFGLCSLLDMQKKNAASNKLEQCI